MPMKRHGWLIPEGQVYTIMMSGRLYVVLLNLVEKLKFTLCRVERQHFHVGGKRSLETMTAAARTARAKKAAAKSAVVRKKKAKKRATKGE